MGDNPRSAAGTKGVSRAERESQILDATAIEVARVGYAGLSMATVAAAARVSKPLVYHYFLTKDGLYLACLRRAAAVITEAIESVLADPPPSIEFAARTLAAIFHALEARPEDWKVVFDTSHPADGPVFLAAHSVRAQIAEQAARGATSFLDRHGLTDPVDQSALTRVWTGMVAALIDWWLAHPEQSAQAMVDRTHRLIATIANLPSPTT